MSILFLILARVLVMAPFLLAAILAVFDYSGQAGLFREAYPQIGAAFPLVIGVKGLVSLIVIFALPFHRTLSVILALYVVGLASQDLPYWHFIGDERMFAMSGFTGAVAQAGGFLLIACMPRR